MSEGGRQRRRERDREGEGKRETENQRERAGGREGGREGGKEGGRDRETRSDTHNPLEESRGGLSSKGVCLLGSESAILQLLLAPRHLFRMSESHSESERESE